ncbi:MAG: alpha-galactosidase [Capsulimonadaceae bacterium]|nr:alpha-galactosidase [Capsulimonadaceae bacterium]
MTIEILSEFAVADTTVRYRRNTSDGRVSVELIPTALLDKVVVHREGLRPSNPVAFDHAPATWNPGAYVLDPLAHVKIAGDEYTGGFGQGRTMRSSPSNNQFMYEKQDVIVEARRTTVVTRLFSDSGHVIEHNLAWYAGDRAVEVWTAFINGGNRPVTLEMLTSFSLGGITPFDAADAPEKLLIHRFRSGWSAEGRLDTQSIEQLHLEPSWIGHGVFSERFGQVGSMPVRGWFPFIAAEDKAAGVVWGAQLAWAGSWQMEAYRRDDFLAISGGLADREFGHWFKTLTPGERLTTPPAALATVNGSLDDLCDRLTRVQHRAADRQPAPEHDLPIVFNEWCTTWGDPTHERLSRIASKLQGSKTRYLVIDAGWYKNETGDWGSSHGDWIPSKELFPDGLKATADMIRAAGFVPGLWFEMENCGSGSEGYRLVDLHLKRDGVPITVGGRRFWDLENHRAIERLSERVIDLLESCGFGYLKVDYNETLGIGTDGAESQGEGLRRHIEGVHRFFKLIRRRLPDLVIENCSSGGHRLEPSMIGLTAMSSFSDAHEVVEIPIVAANLHRLMLPRQSQIWAVLHHADTDRRLIYSLAATFLGRMCLSGDVDDLDERQWGIVHAAEDLYARASATIKYGASRRTGETSASWRHPRGWQAVTRVADDGRQALVVLHAFANAPAQVSVTLPEGAWKIVGQLGTGDLASVAGNALIAPVDGDFSGRAVLLASTASDTAP